MATDIAAEGIKGTEGVEGIEGIKGTEDIDSIEGAEATKATNDTNDTAEGAEATKATNDTNDTAEGTEDTEAAKATKDTKDTAHLPHHTQKKGDKIMKKMMQQLEQKLAFFEKLLRQVNRTLRQAPDGSLKINVKDGYTEYYRREPGESGKNTYISAHEEDLPRELAQKDYDKKMQRLLTAKSKAISCFLKHYPADDIDGDYYALTPQRQALVTPVTPTKRQRVQDWLDQPFTSLGFRPENVTSFYTAQNLRVRSKAELLIANELDRLGIPYKYECPLVLDGVTIHPDFSLFDVYRNRVIYLEHCGMMGNIDYAKDWIKKWDLYISNGIMLGDRLILTFETGEQPLNTRSMRSILAHYLPEYYENDTAE